MSDRQRIIVIGCGGIGKALLPHLCRFLNYDERSWQVVLVDGNAYEDKNAKRQSFSALGNKAEVSRDELVPLFPNLIFEAIAAYVAGPNDTVSEQQTAIQVSGLIKDGDTVFLCVDNHKARLTVSQYCQTLANVRLISGGNDLTDGNVQIFIRRKNKNLMQPIEEVHSEISEAKSQKGPHEMSCEELAQAGTPQVYVANVMAATLILCAFWAELNRANKAGEIYFTIQQVGTACGPAAAPFERKSIS